MQFLTKDKCAELGKKTRWEYFRKVVDYLKIINPKSSLELGCASTSVVLDGDTIDKDKLPNITYCWNALNLPWPVENKKYDVFVALQVWEHLKKNHNKVFQEVPRVSRWAILSLPYKWKHPGFHGGITKSVIKKWTHPYLPFIKPLIIKNRIMYVFKFSKNIKQDKEIKKRMEQVK